MRLLPVTLILFVAACTGSEPDDSAADDTAEDSGSEDTSADTDETADTGDSDSGGDGPSAPYVGDVEVEDPAGLEFLCDTYDSIDGDLVVEGAAINTLASLSCLREVTGDVQVLETSLVDVSGLESLETIGGTLRFYRNASLTQIDDLSALTAVGAYIYFESNVSLTQVLRDDVVLCED